MRAVVYSETGPSSVLQVVERDLPEPGPGEVRVRVVRAGVNPTDWKFRAGMMSGVRRGRRPARTAPGVVDAVGAGRRGARRRRPGLAGAGPARPGRTAPPRSTPSSRSTRVGAAARQRATFDLGASLGVPAVTAHRALTAAEDGPRRLGPGALAGRVVLVAGGAGAVGNAAIQLARWSGATVVTTVSSDEKAALARAAGAHHVVNYRETDATQEIPAIAPDGVDIAVEVAPAQNIGIDLEVVQGARPGLDLRQQRRRRADDAAAGGVREEPALPVPHPLHARTTHLVRAAVEDVTAAVAAGALRVGEDAGLPLHHYPLEQTAAAHDAVENGAVGKVLIDVADVVADRLGSGPRG